MRNIVKTSRLIVTLIILAGSPRWVAGEEWQVGSTPSFSSGRYGTDSRTHVLYTPFSARRLFDAGDLTVVLPFLCISGNGAVTVVNGLPVRTERIEAATAAGATSGRAGPDAGTRTTSTSRTGSTTTSLRRGFGVVPQPVTNCGLGDVVVRGRYYVIDERERLPTVAVRAHVKLPTASAERGLGTGRPDEGIGVEISRTLGGGVMAMVDGGYTVIGEPDGVQYSNAWWYDLGVGKDVASGRVNVSVFFEEHAAIVPGIENGREVLASLTVKGASGWRIQVLGQVGLSDGAPDHGLMFGASRRF